MSRPLKCSNSAGESISFVLWSPTFTLWQIFSVESRSRSKKFYKMNSKVVFWGSNS